MKMIFQPFQKFFPNQHYVPCFIFYAEFAYSELVESLD